MKILHPGNPTLAEITSKTWEDVTCLDDCILERDRKVLDILKKEIISKKRCPHFKKEGDYFYFCGKNLAEEDLKDDKLGPMNKKYNAHVGICEMQFYCIEHYEKCCVYQGKFKK